MNNLNRVIVIGTLVAAFVAGPAMRGDGGKVTIRWKEHRIDDRELAGVGIGGSDGLAVADLDRDGRLDVVAVHENCLQRVRISFGTDDPEMWESHTLSPGPGEAAQSNSVVGGGEDVVIGDVNGDGLTDFITTRGNSRPLDGVIWLEQIRSAESGSAFLGAWPEEQASRQQPIPTQ